MCVILGTKNFFFGGEGRGGEKVKPEKNENFMFFKLTGVQWTLETRFLKKILEVVK